MTALVPIILIGWIPITFLLFTLLPKRHAVLASLIGGVLFLPMAGFSLPGIPDFDKHTAIALSLLICVVLFDAARIVRFQFHWVDVVAAVWLISPLPASLTNGLGFYDGAAATLTQIFVWGVPYFVGRMYFSDPAGLRLLALGLVIGGLIYVPFCLYEIRMSPVLHAKIYGYHQHGWSHAQRFGGYRPTVFMQHGLMVGLWMTITTLVAIWLAGMRSSDHPRTLWHIPMWAIAAVLVVTTVLCKSLGALALLAFGIGLMMLMTSGRWRLVVATVVLVAPLYLATRIAARWDGAQMVEVAAKVDPDRAASLATRLENEEMLLRKAMQRPVFGWGGWGRWRITDDDGDDISITDSLWIITMGQRGAVGLVSCFALLLLPPCLLVRRWKGAHAAALRASPAPVLALVLALFAIDCLLNAMINPVYVMVAGGVAGFATLRTTKSAHVPVMLSDSSHPSALPGITTSS